MRELFATEYRDELCSTLRHAESTRQHRFSFFGRQFSTGERIDWHADPESGRRWPLVFHADVPVHRGDVGYGDVKYVWELNRHQFVVDLAKAYFLTGSTENVGAIRTIVRSWLADNPYGIGVNWACALEPAFRVLSWLWAYHLTVDALDDEFHIEWLGGFYDHGRFLERHLEHYSSPYNHLIGEATALYMLGLAMPEFRRSARWRASARHVLEARLAEQFYGDGGSVEQSLFYHHATIGFYVMAGLSARAGGEELAPEVWRAIERGIAFSASMAQPDGTTPEIGGADDGKPIRMEHLPFWDFRPYQAIGAVLFDRPDFKTVAGRFFEDALWLLGPEGRARFDALGTQQPDASTALVGSGYYIMRGGRPDAADYVCVDCGEQAAGMRSDAVPNSMHGHADCLSVIVWLDGRRVLVDSGLYAYNCGGEWEAHFRETAAHNTARVDGRDQALHLGKMAWSHSYRPRPEAWTADAREAWFVGSHDGYAQGPGGVTHRRAVWLRDGGYLVILDEFTGSGKHDLEVNYQFAPGRLLRDASGLTSFDESVDAAWTGNSAWAPDIRLGGQSPADGWIARSLGVREPAPRLTLRATISVPRATLLTVFAARRGAGPRIIRGEGVNAGEPQVLGIEGDNWTDFVATAGGERPLAITTDALLAICRTRHGAPPDVTWIGGTYAHADARALAAAAQDAAVSR